MEGQNALARPVTADLYNPFLAYLDAAPKTVQTYGRALRQFFRYLAANDIRMPRREDVADFREGLKASGHKPATVQGYVTAVRLFFQWTEQEGIYPNIAQHIKGAKLDKAHKRDYLTCGQVKEILDSVPRSSLLGARDYAMLAIMVTGGLRTIEVSRADIGDLRPAGGHMVLYIQGKGRTEKTEFVSVPAPVEKAVRVYLKERGESDPSAPLFASLSNNHAKGRLTTRSISGIVKRRMQEAGYDSGRLTAHSLRHTAITLSLLAGKDITEVQQFARHSNLSTTMIYSHHLDQIRNSCGDAISNAIF